MIHSGVESPVRRSRVILALAAAIWTLRSSGLTDAGRRDGATVSAAETEALRRNIECAMALVLILSARAAIMLHGHSVHRLSPHPHGAMTLVTLPLTRQPTGCRPCHEPVHGCPGTPRRPLPEHAPLQPQAAQERP